MIESKDVGITICGSNQELIIVGENLDDILNKLSAATGYPVEFMKNEIIKLTTPKNYSQLQSLKEMVITNTAKTKEIEDTMIADRFQDRYDIQYNKNKKRGKRKWLQKK